MHSKGGGEGEVVPLQGRGATRRAGGRELDVGKLVPTKQSPVSPGHAPGMMMETWEKIVLAISCVPALGVIAKDTRHVQADRRWVRDVPSQR